MSRAPILRPTVHPGLTSDPLPSRTRRGEHGQILMIFAIGLAAILGLGSLGFDTGRFYSERRYLQNAADAGALAVANALIRGAGTNDAIDEGRAVITRNILNSPTASGVTAPALTPEYADGHANDPLFLTDGILISGNDVRVAIGGTSQWTLGRALGLGAVPIIAQARARLNGDLLPIAVRKFVNVPGPNNGASYPCTNIGPHDFQAMIVTAATSCLGTATDGSLRTVPSPGLPFDPSNHNNDPVNHGPIQTIVGINAKPSNNADFRGFVALDIRNFAFDGSNVFYNGAVPGMMENSLKNLEAGWVPRGYPGPGFPLVVSPPDPALQVGILNGNASGIVLDAISKRYGPGDEILAPVYSGTVMTIPDFTLELTNTVAIGTTQNRNGQVTHKTVKSRAFAGLVDTSAFKDWGDTQNPYGTTLSAFTFSPNPITPDGTVTWTTLNTTAAPVGVSTVWIQGHSGSPYLTDHYFPVAINVGGVQRDFTTSVGGVDFYTATTGGTATGTFTISTPNSNATAFLGNVALAIEGGAKDNGVLPAGIGARTLSSNSVTLNKGSTHTITVSINAGSLVPGVHHLTLAAWGINSVGQKVTRLFPITLSVAVGATSKNYIDIEGFGVFRITRSSSNEIEAYAISDAYADLNDPRLRRGQLAKLYPWNF